MSYGSTRNRDIAIVAILALILVGGYFVYKNNSSKAVQAADAELFLCENSRSITALWLPGEEGRVVLRLSHGPKVYLYSVPSESGKYESADNKITFWTNGDEANIIEGGKATYAECVKMRFQEE
jgi:membrane-bound inhibitor of C-type lysozyme